MINLTLITHGVLHGTVHSTAEELSQPRESVPMNSSFQIIDSNIAFWSIKPDKKYIYILKRHKGWIMK